MKKKQFIHLALIGVASGALILSHEKVSAAEKKLGTILDTSADNEGSGHVMTEDELLLELTPEGEKLYNSLSKEGKELARKVASQHCNGTNECKGLNACKDDDHDCAGQGSCKGKGKCAFSDKNLAVKIVADKMKAKRINASK